VGDGDGPDDGQAKAVAAVAPGLARTESLEGLEQAVDLGGRDDRPGVADRQDGPAAAGPGTDQDISAWDVVPHGVIDQVGHQLLDQERIALEGGGPDLPADTQVQAADPGPRVDEGGGGDGR
jgi:hypothetical protein